MDFPRRSDSIFCTYRYSGMCICIHVARVKAPWVSVVVGRGVVAGPVSHLNRRVHPPPGLCFARARPFSFRDRDNAAAVPPLPSPPRKREYGTKENPEIGFSICHRNVLAGLPWRIHIHRMRPHEWSYVNAEPCGRRQKLINKIK